MPTETRWKASLSATCLHAAACQNAGIAAADPELGAALDGPVAGLLGEIHEIGWDAAEVLDQLLALSSEYENNRELVRRALARLRIPPHEVSIQRVAGAVADVEAALRRAQPEIVEELAVRGRPIREQWEARGPGMLVQMGRLTEEGAVPEVAEIVLVGPYAGGHGWAHAAQNRVTFEAVLANPHAELPEAVRLAWLVGQLNGDLPRYADALPPGRAVRACAMAMLAPALDAAQEVEAAKCDEATLGRALEAWRVGGDLPADAASIVWQWWRTWLDGADKWPIAVAALDGMLSRS